MEPVVQSWVSANHRLTNTPVYFKTTFEPDNISEEIYFQACEQAAPKISFEFYVNPCKVELARF